MTGKVLRCVLRLTALPRKPRHTCAERSCVNRRSARSMASFASIDSVRRKILSLQQAAYEAEDRAELLQEEADTERQARQRVTAHRHTGDRDTGDRDTAH